MLPAFAGDTLAQDALSQSVNTGKSAKTGIASVILDICSAYFGQPPSMLFFHFPFFTFVSFPDSQTTDSTDYPGRLSLFSPTVAVPASGGALFAHAASIINRTTVRVR